MAKRDDIIWLSGLLEGEGCFSLKKGKYPMVSLDMTDEDIVVRAAALMKTRVTHRRNVWSFHVHGSYAIQWMMTLLPLLGIRRSEMVVSVIKFWKERTYGKSSNGIRAMATCHPDRIVMGFGLCSVCYQKQYREKKLLKKVG